MCLGQGVYPKTCPCRHGRACAQPGWVNGDVPCGPNDVGQLEIRIRLRAVAIALLGGKGKWRCRVTTGRQ